MQELHLLTDRCQLRQSFPLRGDLHEAVFDPPGQTVESIKLAMPLLAV